MATEKEKVNYYASVRTFFEEVYAESKRISWPSRETLVQSSLLVMVVILALSAVMGSADVLLNLLFTYGIDKFKGLM